MILTLRRNGQITLPAEVRRRMRATEGDIFVAEVRDDDEIVLRKKSLVDASQAYFWTDESQRGEREAQEPVSFSISRSLAMICSTLCFFTGTKGLLRSYQICLEPQTKWTDLRGPHTFDDV